MTAAAPVALANPARQRPLSTITIFSPALSEQDEGEDEDASAFTFVLMRSRSGLLLQQAVAAGFGLTVDSVAGVEDTRGSLFSFDTVVQAPDLFAQGKYKLARTGKKPTTSTLAPRSLAHLSVDQFVDAFRAASGETSALTLQQFTRCMRQLSPQSSTQEIGELFAKFDLDGNGLIDPSEFVAGGTVLCGGDRDTKIQLSFKLLDLDGNGVLDQEEITKYMQSVFRVVALSSPDAFAEHSPEALAQVTAESAMQFSRNGVLSFAQFRAWMLTDDDDDDEEEDGQEGLNLHKIQHATGLGQLELEQVVDIMIDHSNLDGVVDRLGFGLALEEICSQTGRDFSQVSKRDLDLFFRAVDVDGSQTCDVDELSTAFSVLCAGSRDTRCLAAFRLFDSDGDGFLDLGELTKMLASVFRVLFASNSQLADKMQCSPDELASITAIDALHTLDLNGDGLVSFDEFREWYAGEEEDDDDDDEESWLNLNETRRLTGLGSYNPSLVMEAFALVADDEGMVPKEEFFATLQRLAPREGLSAVDQTRARYLGHKLFALYQEDETDERVDFSTLAVALAMLCGGREAEKKQSIFDLMDLDQSGTVERDEFVRFMVATMQALFAVQPRVATELGVSPQELAEVVAEDAFEKFDTNADGKLSFDEFCDYWEVDGKADMGGSASAPSSTSRSLRQVREILALEQYSAEDLFETIASSRQPGGSVSYQEFFQILSQLAKQNRELAKSELKVIDQQIDRLYHSFDTDRNGVVDFTELAVGLSLLCGGTPDARAEAAFRLFQSPDAQEGTITLQGMADYLTVMFRTMSQVGGAEAQQHFLHGETPEQLALETAQSVFTEADLNHDGTLNFDEWKKFYNAEDNPAAVEVRTMVQQVHVPIQEIKHRTGLNLMLPEQVFEHFARAADEQGELTRAAFVAVFEHLAPPPHDARLHLCIDSLFALLDEDGNDRVDYVELSTGLSVLTMGSKRDKLGSAFSLLDLDGSGTIDQEELERYCASVYRIMFSDPASKERLLEGKSVAQHARETASEVMHSAALSVPGQLTLDEFIQWIEGGEDAAAIVTNAQIGPDSELTLPELAKLLRLSGFTAPVLFEHFAAFANRRQELSRNSFVNAVRAVQSKSNRPLSPAEALKADWAIHHLFDALDANGDGAVDVHELSAGLSILAKGSRDDKVRAAFALYDVDGNGFIDPEEMVSYLTSVYKVTFVAHPEAVRGLDPRLTPERLALATTKDIFQTCDVNGDGQLSFEEFKQWYSSTTTSTDAPEEEEEEHQWEEQDKTPCGTAAHITGLDQMTPNQAFALFVRFADARTGKITRTGFVQALKSLQQAGDATGRDFIEACLKMHALFDVDRDGMVDLEELSIGLAMVLNPRALMDTSSLFDLFSQGHEYITYQALEVMLETIFKLQLSEGADSEAAVIARGSSPKELAQATASAILELADANHDGKVSRSEFQRFIEHTTSGEALSKLVVSTESSLHVGGLEGLREVTGLANRDVGEVMLIVAQVTDDGDRELKGGEFFELMQTLSPSHDLALLQLVSQRLFVALDVDQSHSLSANELNAGLSVLCRGNKFKRAADAFALYDLDQDGFVSLDELFYYLRSVFRVLKVGEPEQYREINPDTLAFETANKILMDADVSGDGKISLEEFLQWTDADHTRVAPALRAGGVASLGEARELLHLTHVSATELFEVLAEHADELGEISRKAFTESLLHFANDDPQSKRRAVPMVNLLFDVLDGNGNGRLDFCEVASGMSILVGGDKMEKVRLACELFDADGDGYISRDEMLAYLQAVFAVVLATHQDAAQRLGAQVDAKTLAQATCDEAFLTADVNGDGKLDYNEFAAWILADDAGIAMQHMMEPLHDKLDLQELRDATGLGSVSPEEMFCAIVQSADSDGLLTRQAFAQAFHQFTRHGPPHDGGGGRILVSRLFDLLDVNGDGMLSCSELAAGLSVLCRGTQKQKTQVAFDAFDHSGEQQLDQKQVQQLLQSVFRLLLATVRDAEHQTGGASAEELAFLTAQQCFAEKDPAGTGLVSLLDFHDFFEHAL